MRIQRPILALILATVGLLGMAGEAPGQMIVNWGFTPGTTVPDNGSVGDVRTLGGFASYSNITVSLNLTSQTPGDPMFLGDMYANLTLGNQLAGETQRTAVLLNRPGRSNGTPSGNAFGSSLSSLNVTLDDSATQPNGNVWGTTTGTGTYNSDGRLGVAANGAPVAFSDGDRNATLTALNGAAFASNRFALLVADYSMGGIATLSNYGYGVTGAAATSGTLDAGGATGTFSIGDTGSGASNTVGAAVVTTQSGGGPLIVNIAGTMNMTGGVSGTSGLTKQGTGTLTLSSTGSFTGATIVDANGGTLNAATTDALKNTSSITVNNGGTLLLSGAGNLDRVNNAADISLAGGTIQKGAGASEGTTSSIGLGALTLMATGSAIDFTGTAGTLTFASFAPGMFVLAITNYIGNGMPSGFDQLIFNQSQSGQLNSFDFGFGAGMNVAQLDLMNGFFEVYSLAPVPEPGTWAAGILTVLALGYSQRKRLKNLGLRVSNSGTKS